MRQFILPLALLACLCTAHSQTITQAEWFIGTDPGIGMGNPITVNTPGDSLNLSFTVPTDSLATGLYQLYIRCRDNLGRWGPADRRPLVVTYAVASSQPRLITQAEYWVDNNPSILVDISDSAQVNISELVSTQSLQAGLHYVYMRYRDDLGRWSPIDKRPLLVTLPLATSQTHLITRAEYWVDSNPATLVEFTDSTQVSISELVSTQSLGVGIHNMYLRCQDDLGRWSVADRRTMVVTSPAAVSQPRLITQAEYWVDSNPPTLVDVTDSTQVNISELISTQSLEVGLHDVYLRYRDDLGRWGAIDRRPLIVTSPFSAVQLRQIMAAEYFVNVDPGPGNGVAIPLPQDSTWDEGEETVQTILTGVPLGFHLVGIRVRDDVGRWSRAVMDTLLVGPILTVHTSGNNVILDWMSGSGADQFHIYRSSTPSGSFAQIDSTTAQTYTDYGIISTNDRSFYQVTFSPRTLSNFRLPESSSSTRNNKNGK